jgi:hypothetical protein
MLLSFRDLNSSNSTISCEFFLLVCARPDSVLARRQHALWIQCVFDLLIQFHQRITVEIVGVGNLVHQREMGAVLSPAFFGSIFDQCLYKAESTFFAAKVFAVEDNADNMMHLSHTNDESTDKIEAMLLATAACELVLSYGGV